jgi:ABC-2 type transport system ATP-binding protein
MMYPIDGRDANDGLLVRELVVEFKDFRLGPISFTLDRGGILALIGTNGSGKSTLIRSLLGIQNIHGGSVRWDSEPMNKRSPWLLSGVGYVSDSNRDVLAEFTSTEFWHYRLLAYERARGRRFPEAMDRAYRFAELLDFPYKRRVSLSALSLGTSRKAQLIGALMVDPELLILDEPFIGLDFLSARALEKVLATLNAEGTTILVSNHDLDLASRLATSALVLHQGKLVLNSSVEELGGVALLERSVSQALESARTTA